MKREIEMILNRDYLHKTGDLWVVGEMIKRFVKEKYSTDSWMNE